MGTEETGGYRNRFEEAMCHTVRYAFEGRAKLARDCGISRMSVTRLLSERHNPSYRLVHAVVAALERALGRPLDARDLITYTGDWERSICDVCGCTGCLPDGALLDDGTLDPTYLDVAPGTWKSFQPLGEERTLYRKEDE